MTGTWADLFGLDAAAGLAPRKATAPLAELPGDWPFGDLQQRAYGTILADPPWQFALHSDAGEGKSPQAHYQCMDANAAAYRASPAGIKAAQEAAEWLTRLQTLHDELMAKLPGVVTDEAALIQWCEDFSRTDHIGIKGRNYPGAIALMEAAGWRRNDMVGQREEIEAQPTAMARWLIGQAMDCMASGLPPHGITEKFAAEYRRMRGGA